MNEIFINANKGDKQHYYVAKLNLPNASIQKVTINYSSLPMNFSQNNTMHDEKVNKISYANIQLLGREVKLLGL